MRQMFLEMSGQGLRWALIGPVTHIGRDPKCEVRVSAQLYPMVSLQHVAVRAGEDQVVVEDLNTPTGTFLNGRRIQSAAAAVGDTIRLGSRGPEFRLLAVGMQVEGAGGRAVPQETKIAGAAAQETRVAGLDALQATRVAHVPAEPGRAAHAAAGGGRAGYGAAAQPAPAPEMPEAVPARPSDSFAPAGTRGSSSSAITAQDIGALEQKINSLRTLLIVAVVLVVLLAGMLMNTMRGVDRNRQELNAMRQDAMQSLMPKLDERMTSLDARLTNAQRALDGVDGRIHAAEDRLVKRMETELPRIMDSYVEKKAKDLKRNGALP